MFTADLAPFWLVRPAAGDVAWHWAAAAVGGAVGVAWPLPGLWAFELGCVGVALWAVALEFLIPVDAFLLATLPLCAVAQARPWQLWAVMGVGAAHWVWCAAREEALGAGEGGWAGSAAWTGVLVWRYVAGSPSRAWAAPRLGVVAARLLWPRRVSLVGGALVFAAAERCQRAGEGKAVRGLQVLLALGGVVLAAVLGPAAPAALAAAAVAGAAAGV